MACFFIDMDQTFVWSGTYEPHKDALDQVRRYVKNGHQIVFITKRKDFVELQAMLIRLGLSNSPLLCNLDFPRVLICDREPIALKHHPDGRWGPQHRVLEDLP